MDSTTPIIEIISSTSSVEFETTPTIVCYSNEIPTVPNFVFNLSEDNTTYNIGAVVYYSCHAASESIANQTNFISCSSDGTWSLNNINLTMCENISTEQTTTTEDIPRSTSHSNRQIRQVVSHCKDFPQIEHAQMLSDETIQYKLNDEITYIGSVTFVCQYGFFSNISENESFRVTCQNGDFYPKVICTGKRI